MNSFGRTRSCPTRQLFRGGARPPTEVAAFVAAHRDHGVVPICRVLHVDPSVVRSALARPACARRLTDEAIQPTLLELFDANYSGPRAPQDESRPATPESHQSRQGSDRASDACARHSWRDQVEEHDHDPFRSVLAEGTGSRRD